jgi:putative addiction module component (TIGR02574 family)
MKALAIDQLSIDERLLLVEEIWDSIAAEPGAVAMTEAQKQDLQRRITAYEANPHAGDTWEVVKARSRSQCELRISRGH